MTGELLTITHQLAESYNGEPWFGRSLKALLAAASSEAVLQKPNGQHSLLELLYHIIAWREFTITRLQPEAGKDSAYFEKQDWQPLDHNDKNLWYAGLKKLDETQSRLVQLLKKQHDGVLDETVPERAYDFRTLLYGIVQHDIYHIGQIAYLTKLLKS